jgi:hypothetical protein
MPVFKIHHITRYTYDKAVKESVNQIRLFPSTIALNRKYYNMNGILPVILSYIFSTTTGTTG